MAGTALKSVPKDTGIEAKIDRCGYLLAMERRAKPWRDELSALKAELIEHCNDRPSKAVRLKGSLYYLDLTPREMRREITDQKKAWAALKSAIGIDRLIGLITISFKVLDTAIPRERQASFVASDRTGPREVTAGLIKSPTAA